MSKAGAVFARLNDMEINRAGRHALVRLISGYRTTNAHDLEPAEIQSLLDLLAEVRDGLEPAGAF